MHSMEVFMNASVHSSYESWLGAIGHARPRELVLDLALPCERRPPFTRRLLTLSGLQDLT